MEWEQIDAQQRARIEFLLKEYGRALDREIILITVIGALLTALFVIVCIGAV